VYYDWKIECLEAENVYTHRWMAYLLFNNFHFRQCHLVAQVAFWAEVLPVLEQVRRILCASSMSADSLLWHFGMEGSRPVDFYEPLLDDFLSKPSPFACPRDSTPCYFSSWTSARGFLISCCVFSIAARKNPLWPFWPYSRPGACWTVPAVPDLLASP